MAVLGRSRSGPPPPPPIKSWIRPWTNFQNDLNVLFSFDTPIGNHGILKAHFAKGRCRAHYL